MTIRIKKSGMREKAPHAALLIGVIVNLNHLPGPQGAAAFRAGRDYRRNPIDFLLHAGQQYGDVFRFSNNVAFTGHPGYVRKILARTNRETSADVDVLRGKQAARPIVDTDEWMQKRPLATERLKPGIMKEYAAGIEGVIDEELRRLAMSDCITLEELTEISVRAAMPPLVRSGPESLVKAIIDASRAIFKVLDSGTHMPPWLTYRPRQQARHLTQLLQNETRHLFDQHETGLSLDAPLTVLEYLAQVRDDVPVSRRVDSLRATLVATARVPGAAMAWLLYELALRPDSADRIRNEVENTTRASMGGDIETHKLVPFTTSFVYEVLRLHPPTWLMSRRTLSSVDLGGYKIPGDQEITFSPYLLHRDPRWWNEEPARFNPARWLSGGSPHAPFAYLPFGAGPRVCYGAALGQTILTMTAAKVAAYYQIGIDNCSAVRPKFGVPLIPENFRVRLIPR